MFNMNEWINWLIIFQVSHLQPCKMMHCLEQTLEKWVLSLFIILEIERAHESEVDIPET